LSSHAGAFSPPRDAARWNSIVERIYLAFELIRLAKRIEYSLAKRMITPTPLVITLSAANANITMFVIHRRKNSPLIRT
jgi:hypothetical protein